MSRHLFVFEDIETTPRHRLFRFQGVEVSATSYAWLSPCSYCTLGVMVSFGQRSENIFTTQVVVGLGYGLLLYLTNACHSLGHIFAAKWVGAPMEVLLLTATRDVTLYKKDGLVPTKWMFIGRSLGGPVTNLLAGVASLPAWYLLSSRWCLFFSIFNLAVGAWTLFPVPSMDGWVIWGELFGFRRRSIR
jgi:Zn-dependent protease